MSPLLAPVRAAIIQEGTMTQAEKDDLLAKLDRMQSVGATVLSNATAVRKVVEQMPVDDATA